MRSLCTAIAPGRETQSRIRRRSSTPYRRRLSGLSFRDFASQLLTLLDHRHRPMPARTGDRVSTGRGEALRCSSRPVGLTAWESSWNVYPMPDAAVGERIGAYRLLRKLGRGGMGEVWRAEHVEIASQVAIKIVLADHDDHDATARFLREAKAVARIRHPGVVTVSDYGTRDRGGAFLVMELLDGEPLADRVARGALPVALVIDLALQLCAALEAAHAKEIVHRDLKPANIFLVPDSATRNGVRAKLLDFGVAKQLDADTTAATMTGALVGTPIYMAPEQLASRTGPIDRRVDLYALGIVLYELLAGKPPFRGPSLGDLVDQHLHVTPVSLDALAPSAPLGLRRLVDRLLAKAREARPDSASTVARAL